MSAPDSDARWRVVTLLASVAITVVLTALLLGVAVPDVASPLGSEQQQVASEGPVHENPESVQGEGELSALERQLAGQLRQQAEEGAIDLGPEDYEQAREQLGDDEYQQLLDEYGNVASELGGQERQRLFAGAQRTQRNHTEQAVAYWELYESYEFLSAANSTVAGVTGQPSWSLIGESGDPALRPLARELDRRARLANETAWDAIEAYSRLDNATEEDYEPLRESLRESATTITSAQETVRDEQFVRTNLSLAAEQSVIGPAQPLELTGTVTTARGRPLDEMPVSVEIESQTIDLQPDESGEFELSYRPTQLPANATSVTITAHPAEDSIFLPDSQTLGVDVSPATPTVTATLNRTEAGYNEPISLGGRVAIDGAGLAKVPYVVLADGEILARNETASDGALDADLRLPASVDTGEQSVLVRLLVSEQAVEQATGSTTLDVTERETVLSVTAREGEEGLIRVRGALVTGDGEPVAAQPVQLLVEETPVGTARTDETGDFATQVTLPKSVESGRTEVTVAARYDAETNLQPTRATTTTMVSVSDDSMVPTVSPVAAVPVLALVLLVGGGVLYARRRTSTPETAVEETEPGVTVEETAIEPALERASALLEAGQTAAAVQVGYAAVRAQVGEREEGLTHWEFYQTYREALDEESARLLRAVTEGYEQAAFAPEEVTDGRAAAAIDAVRALAGEAERDGATPADD